MDTLPIDQLGARETAPGSVEFRVLLPWVSPAGGNTVRLKVIHERDQFLRDVPARVFPLVHETDPQWGDAWSATIAIAPDGDGSAWGLPGKYVYRYAVTNPQAGEVDFVGDPFAREFGIGRLSAFTLGFVPRPWEASEDSWRVPGLPDLVMYEMMVSEFARDIEQATQQLAYVRDLGVNCLSLMPLSNVAAEVDWGYLPTGYFGVDERFGRSRGELQRLVERAHALGLAVIVDVVYGHTSELFPYSYLYRRLRYHENPFLGDFGKNYFGESTDWDRRFTRAFFQTVNNYWLDRYHLDGFRYDCVPNFWDGPNRHGYAELTYETYLFVEGQRQTAGPWARFFDPQESSAHRLIQCAEQLEDPRGVLTTTYSNATWQNETFDAAINVARGDHGKLYELGMRLGGDGFERSVTHNATHTLAKRPLQYIENHDHERFLCHFGLVGGHNGLLQEGDREQWYRVQPYLIALLLSHGIPLLWQGQELGEKYWVPPEGLGRVMLLRPVRWDLFYDDIGRSLLGLVRRVLSLRRERAEFRRGEYYFTTTSQPIKAADCYFSVGAPTPRSAWWHSTSRVSTSPHPSRFLAPAPSSSRSMAMTRPSWSRPVAFGTSACHPTTGRCGAACNARALRDGSPHPLVIE
jgi:maltooligosyltrehalose trehalohydrolase